MIVKKQISTKEKLECYFEKFKPVSVHYRDIAEYFIKSGWNGEVSTVGRALAEMTNTYSKWNKKSQLILRLDSGYYGYNPAFIPESKHTLDAVFAQNEKIKYIEAYDDEIVVVVRKKSNSG